MARLRARISLALVAFSLLLPFSRTCQAIFNTSIPNYVDFYKPMAYAVVGQQKSGTSTLWNVLTSNPAIKWVGHGKESFFFNGDYTTRCDSWVEGFQTEVAVQRLRYNRTDLLIGDWSTTHFSCSCCPLALKTLNSKLKVVVVLRDPVQRALSRFVEQKRNVKMPYHHQVANYTFAEFAQLEAAVLNRCISRAAPFRQSRAGLVAQGRPVARQEQPVGWGAGLDVGRWLEMQCFSRSNILGWSVYDVFLENYLAHFPVEQVLVLYTDDLFSHPLESVLKVHDFLGAPPHRYDPNMVSLIYNSRDCYHWRCARKKTDIQTQSGILDAGAGDAGPGQKAHQQDSLFVDPLTRLADLYRPHVQRLFDWADQGLIAQPPEAWRKRYS